MLTVNNLTGFGGKGNRPPITLVGSITNHAPDSGTGTATHTYNSKTSAGPYTIVCMSGPGNVDLSNITWGGVSANDVVAGGSGSTEVGAAIFQGAHSGDIQVILDDTCSDTHITIMRFSGLSASSFAADDKSATTSSTSATVSTVGSPGAGGLRIGVVYSSSDSGSVSWSGLDTEASDLDAGAFRHSVSYQLGDVGTSVTASGNSGTWQLLVASVR